MKRGAVLMIAALALIAVCVAALSTSVVAKGPDDQLANDAFAPDGIGATSALSNTQTSMFLFGNTVVSVIFVESNGAIDQSSENWTAAQRQSVMAQIQQGAGWWTGKEPRAFISWTFTQTVVPSSYEPISRPYTDQSLWIAEIMAGLGYSGGNYFERVRAYETDLRDSHESDWVFTIFAVDSDGDADHYFAQSQLFSYAYIGGPFMVVTSHPPAPFGTGGINAVVAHETGHIFGALDQAYSAAIPCSALGGYLGIENQNSQYGSCQSNAASIMRGGTIPYINDAIDDYARGQVGWRDRDEDGVLDPADTPVNVIQLSMRAVAGSPLEYTGHVSQLPFTSSTFLPGFVNAIDRIQHQLNNHGWVTATATMATFNSPIMGAASGNFWFETDPITTGDFVQIRAVDEFSQTLYQDVIWGEPPRYCLPIIFKS